MKKMIRLELKRAFTGPGFLISVLVGVAITTVYFWNQVLPIDLEYMISETSKKMDPRYPGILFGTWFGVGRVGAAEKRLFFTILPLLASLPFAESYFNDRRSGFINNVCLRTDRKNYFVAKYLAVFLSGGAAVTIPLVTNFLLTSMFMPWMDPIYGFEVHKNYTTPFAHLFYEQPLLYVLMNLAVIFIFSGLLACVALYASHHVGYSFLALMAPFAVYLFINSGLELLGLELCWRPNVFLDPAYDFDSRLPIFIESTVLFLFTFGTFVLRQPKRDVLN